MTYTITWTRGSKVVILKSFAGMMLWASDPKWQWVVGRSVERVIGWVSDPPSEFRWRGPAMRWSVSE